MTPPTLAASTSAFRTSRSWTRASGLAIAIAITLVGGACGADDDDDAAPSTEAATDTGAPSTTEATDEPVATDDSVASDTSAEPSEDEPVRGGEATALYFSDIPVLDPIRFTGGASSDGHMGFAIFGALVGLDPAQDNTVVPILAESLQPDDTFTQWTLTLRPGVTFSDGTDYDAAAVQSHWNRVADPANRSAGAGLMASVTSSEVTDPLTLVISLRQPNAWFPNALSQTGSLNQIPSPTAIANGVDFSTEPVGAGPWLVDERVAGSSTTFVPNPDWQGSEGPYLDRFTIAVVGDEQQRVDTFLTGDGDLFYTLLNDSVEQATDDGAEVYTAEINTGSVLLFNTAAPPFDDPRLRQAVALGVDRHALVDIAHPGDDVADDTVRPDSPWAVSGDELPDYDPDAAQALFSEVAAERGASISITLGAYATPQNQTVAEFVQTSLNQFDGVDVELAVADTATAIGRILSGDYQMHTFGVPWTDPEPRLYTALRSGLFSNTSRYANSEVDAALDAARATDDVDVRREQNAIVQRHLAEDLPYLPYLQGASHWVHTPDIHGIAVYEDAILRSDLLWRAT
jgi:peptide/nickel transport system substrate-binding protein